MISLFVTLNIPLQLSLSRPLGRLRCNLFSVPGHYRFTRVYIRRDYTAHAGGAAPLTHSPVTLLTSTHTVGRFCSWLPLSLYAVVKLIN